MLLSVTSGAGWSILWKAGEKTSMRCASQTHSNLHCIKTACRVLFATPSDSRELWEKDTFGPIDYASSKMTQNIRKNKSDAWPASTFTPTSPSLLQTVRMHPMAYEVSAADHLCVVTNKMSSDSLKTAS